MHQPIVNFVVFQAAWFACVLGGAYGYPWTGVIATIVWLGLHLVWHPNREGEIKLFLAGAVLGYLADSILVSAGILVFSPEARLVGPSPLWMVALWLGFVATFHNAMKWMSGRYLLGTVLGVIAGPIAYWGGARLEAVTFADPFGLTMAAISVEWAIAMPLLLYVSKLTELPSEPPEQETE
ncbi:MAG: hypothetical protein CMJ78_07995 [Planctomycetaceae bacterium]|nr:hypothetical protein [Planctomycetaceae bacterium]